MFENSQIIKNLSEKKSANTEIQKDSREIFNGKINKVKEKNPNWKTNNKLTKELGSNYLTIKNITDKYHQSNPEFFCNMKDETGRMREHYSPELIKIITKELNSHQEKKLDWKTNNELSKKLGATFYITKTIANKYLDSNPEFFCDMKDERGKLNIHYSPKLVKIIMKEMNNSEERKLDWKTSGKLAKELKVGRNTIKVIADKYRSSNPEFFGDMKAVLGRPAEHYSPELVKIIIKELNSREERKPDWKTKSELAKELRTNPHATKNIADKYRSSNPEFFCDMKDETGRMREHYAPELIKTIVKELNSREEKKPEWKTSNELAKELKVGRNTIKVIADKYRSSNPEFFGDMKANSGRLTEHYSPELVKIIVEKLNSNQLKNIQNFVQEIAEGQTVEAKEFEKIIGLFDSSSAIDVLYRFRPEFRDIPVESVKGIIADYLGEFMFERNIFNIDDLEIGKEYLSDNNLKNALILNIKKDALSYFHKIARIEKNKDKNSIINEYINQLKNKAVEMKNPHLDEAISEVESYYNSILQLKKPDNIVPSLKEGRVFPDINQLVNIEEIKRNKKMLIADEMGLGKSASAILAKEYLGLKCALIIAPNNVIPTWQKYLSSSENEDGKKTGYFQKGLEPKVLVIEDQKDLENLERPYDYILISQEKLNEKYTSELKKVGFDMLITDEVHKLKNIETGVRSSNLINLAENIIGEEKYLAILSGTPIPNKVDDLAMILKLLYPEDFKDTPNKELVNSMIYGKIVDLRNKLLPRMQMKNIRESIAMPNLSEKTIDIELSKEEKTIYETLWEEDEMTASEKLQVLRKFLLNPELLETSPKTESSKIKTLKQELQKSFKEKDRVICFFNGYIENVIRGDGSIIEKINLPDVEIRTIEGTVSEEDRKEIQKELKSSDKKILLLVSGQTADVGVDFSGAEKVYFYNEPWSKYDKKQQLGRVYREGLENDLECVTLIAKNTIEEGIRKYIDAKEHAIEKLLRGIPRTEIENNLMKNDEKRAEGKNLEINAELAEYYFNKWDRMMRIFSAVKEMGEKNFKKFLEKYGQEYADCYTELGSRTYQGNNSRVVASLLNQMILEKKEDVQNIKILDIASGPEMLKKHSAESIQENILSIDINEKHFKNLSGKNTVASFLNLPIKSNSVDYCNLALALHYTKLNNRKENFERLQVLAEINRVLKEGGRTIISMIYSREINEGAFEKIIGKLGFKIINEYSGEASNENSYLADIITLEKIKDIAEYKFDKIDNKEPIKPLAEKLGEDMLEGLKFSKSKKSIRNSRQMIKDFDLNGKNIEIIFNQKDKEVFEEEESIKSKAMELKIKYDRLEKIPSEEISRYGFARIRFGKNYLLFKKLQNGEGAVILKNDQTSL